MCVSFIIINNANILAQFQFTDFILLVNLPKRCSFKVYYYTFDSIIDIYHQSVQFLACVDFACIGRMKSANFYAMFSAHKAVEYERLHSIMPSYYQVEELMNIMTIMSTVTIMNSCDKPSWKILINVTKICRPCITYSYPVTCDWLLDICGYRLHLVHGILNWWFVTTHIYFYIKRWTNIIKCGHRYEMGDKSQL